MWCAISARRRTQHPLLRSGWRGRAPHALVSSLDSLQHEPPSPLSRASHHQHAPRTAAAPHRTARCTPALLRASPGGALPSSYPPPPPRFPLRPGAAHHGTRVGVLGGGQLGRMLAIAAVSAPSVPSRARPR